MNISCRLLRCHGNADLLYHPYPDMSEHEMASCPPKNRRFSPELSQPPEIVR